jgi:acyl-coenzyme A synthetase/AMP-(fatty) acid ligase
MCCPIVISGSKFADQLLKTHAVQHLLHLDLVHAHGADGHQLAFEAVASHGFEGWVVQLHAFDHGPLVVAVGKVVLCVGADEVLQKLHGVRFVLGVARYGTTGQAVPGYQLRIVSDDGKDCAVGDIGELHISGPTSAIMYWNNRAKTKATFAGDWTKSGDKYTLDADGYYTYGGRSDDMLKVGGIYVSPFEVEACLMTHPAVLEVAVIGVQDDDELVKPKAYVVLKSGQSATADALKAHVKQHLAPYKYPRWIEFVGELPKTATGKIQRFKLRAPR